MPYQPPHDSLQYAAHQHGKGFKPLRYGTVLYDYGRSVRSLVLVRFVAGSGCVKSYIMNHILHFLPKANVRGLPLDHHLHQIVASPYVSTPGGPLSSRSSCTMSLKKSQVLGSHRSNDLFNASTCSSSTCALASNVLVCWSRVSWTPIVGYWVPGA